MKKIKVGQRVKVIDGGIGCRAANGEIGTVTTREESVWREMYFGEYREGVAKLYVKGDTGRYYGLCNRYVVELLTQENE